MEQKIEKVLSFEGLICPPFTAYDQHRCANSSIIPKYANYLSKNGVSGVFVNGTTGDSLSLSFKERRETAEKWILEGKKWLEMVIIHVGSNCLEETQELAKHAENLNADAIAVLPPTYYRPNNDSELISYLCEVAKSAPNTPLIYYHIPFMSGVNINLSTMVGEAQKRIPSFCGAKYTSTDIRDLVICQAKYGKTFKLMLGCEEIFLSVLPFGINTTVGITHNMMPLLSRQVLENFKSNNMIKARCAQEKLIAAVQMLTKHGNLFQVLRATMNSRTTINVGEPRPPLFQLPESDVAALEVAIKQCEIE